MDIGEVLGRAWQIIWKHKILWIFGIFAGCSRGGGGGGGGGGGTSGGQAATSEVNNWIASHPWVVVAFVIVVLVIVILAVLLGTIGRIGLIKGTFKADGGAEHLGFGELWNESRPFFWRVFWLVVLIVVAFLIVLIPTIILGIALTAVTFGLGLLCFLPLLCILILAFLVVGLVVELAEAAIVLEDRQVVDGLRRGWEVFKGNLGPMLIIWLILLVIGLVAGIALALPILVVIVPAAIAFAASSQSSNVSFVPLIIAGLCFVTYLPFLLVLNGILTAYLQSVWTLTFMRLTKPKEVIEAPAVPVPNA